jgi:cytochrome c oxidase subunit 6a
MFPQRTMVRNLQRFAPQLRSQSVRTPFQRRLASSESSAFHGAEDNAFNRERKAVKDHAAASSGMYWVEGVFANNQLTWPCSPQTYGANCPFSKTSEKLKISRRGRDADLHSATIPALIIASANAYVLWNEHWGHWDHMPPLEERTEYPYQNIRTKNFFWGDGDKVSSYRLNTRESPSLNYL